MWDVGFYFRVFHHLVHKCGELIILIKRVVVESEGEVTRGNVSSLLRNPSSDTRLRQPEPHKSGLVDRSTYILVVAQESTGIN